ncbi:hypothetical protein [uncultured Mediterranean phage uvMED]|jgi:hypothetical protein|nr:hypothetical protein [uncultured Mediterranean phage uvMED]|tara:strand:+ start:45 stop:344 length:300 start_codon:yes stop_codon:yes gene_type:complete
MSYNYALRPGTTQKVSFTGSSVASSNVFGTQTEYVRIATTHSCHYVIGGNASSAPTATTSDAYLHAGDYEIIKVSPGEKIAAIRNTSTSGDLFVTEMSA